MFRIMKDKDTLETRRLLLFSPISPNLKIYFLEIFTAQDEGIFFQINSNQDLTGDGCLCCHRRNGDGYQAAGPCIVSFSSV